MTKKLQTSKDAADKVVKNILPGSYKSVRFALELLTSHLGGEQVGALTQAQGREVLGYITQLSPYVRKYSEGRGHLGGACNPLPGARDHHAGTSDPGAYPQADVPVP